jgi:tRNA nucleotidyltransferase (CCA-adding enzyme)
VRFAALMHDLGKGMTPADILPRHVGHEARSADLRRSGLRAPAGALGGARPGAHRRPRTWPHSTARRAAPQDAADAARTDGRFRRPARLDDVLAACEADARGRLGFEHRDYPQSERMRTALKAALAVNAGAVAAAAVASGLRGDAIGQRVHEARCRAIAHALNESHLPLSS